MHFQLSSEDSLVYAQKNADSSEVLLSHSRAMVRNSAAQTGVLSYSRQS